MQTSFTQPMALRVLLADESSTIKKVFQLALQDYAVEVQPVTVGVDVAAVATRFKPDIIFADVLLQRKNGYEVSAELKQNTDLKSIPIVLMWSGFMELDQDKFAASQADGHLEKPFDVKGLRKLVNELVPRTQSQNLSGFLSFPKLPEFIEPPPTAAAPPPPAAPTPAAPEKSKDWSMDDFEPPPPFQAAPEENFKTMPLRGAKPTATPSPHTKNDADLLDDEADDQRWKRHDISRFQIKEDLHRLQEEEPVTFSEPPPPPPPHAKKPSQSQAASPPAEVRTPAQDSREIDTELFDDSMTGSPIRTIELVDDSENELELEEFGMKPLPKINKEVHPLTHEELENIIRAQSKEIIESVVWKVVPEIATTLIEKELKRILRDLN